MLRSFLFTVVMFLVEAPGVHGQQNIFIGIGVDTYDSKDISPTPFCVNDVKLIAEKLRDRERGLFGSPILLHSQQTNKRYLPTKNNILRQLEARIPFLNKKDTLLVYYLGNYNCHKSFSRGIGNPWIEKVIPNMSGQLLESMHELLNECPQLG
ncbi:MAG: hypothetical protein ACFCD0_15440, partial [Gemmataceae bacterium]